jgi:hypothetical protein
MTLSNPRKQVTNFTCTFIKHWFSVKILTSF